MGIKDSNEITVKLKYGIEDVRTLLLEKGYVEQYRFSLEDTFFIPKDLDIQNMSVREILANAVLTRDVVRNNDSNLVEKRITFKEKVINDDGEILSQKQTNCEVFDIEEAKKLLEVIGYKKIMVIKEYDVAYKKDEFFLETKDIVNGDNLMEIETQKEGLYTTIEALKQKLLEEKIPFYTDNYFVKKAEIELSKILGRI